jgi:steroid delta-isomerase-like uncharacterized protein
MNQSEQSAIIKRNLATIENHVRLEATDVDEALKLYTDDVVWESPARRAVYRGKKEIRDNYLRIFSSMKDVVIEPLERFATADRVVDDTLVKFTLSGDGFVNAPLPTGAHVELRLVHIFDMRDGKIAKEKVFELWREI